MCAPALTGEFLSCEELLYIFFPTDCPSADSLFHTQTDADRITKDMLYIVRAGSSSCMLVIEIPGNLRAAPSLYTEREGI